MRNKKTVIQFVVFLLLTVMIFCPLYQVVSASGGFTKQSDVTKLWYGYNENLNMATSSTYPYNETYTLGATTRSIYGTNAIDHVAFDVIYGTVRNLISYTGEVPYDIAYESNGRTKDGFNGLPYNPDASNTVNNGSDVDYWGQSISANSIQSLEDVNKDQIISLRLYALSLASKHGTFYEVFSGGIIYNICQGLASIAAAVVSLVIQVKNLNMTAIMSALNLQEIADVIYELFIAHTDASGNRVLSPLAVICIVVFIFTIVAYAFNYAKGSTKKKFWTDIIALALIGVILVGVGRGTHVLSMGNTVSDLVNAFAVSTMPTTTGTDIWDTKTSDYVGYKANQSMNTMYNEISLVNKTLIDLQICTQFGVSDISELAYTALGDTDGTIAKNTLNEYYIDSSTPVTVTSLATFNTKTNGNLGYYFWYASSPAKQLVNGSSLPDMSTNQPQKLSQMITYLQKVYNKSTTTATQKNQILNIIHHFAKPTVGSGSMNMILLALIYSFLVICLFTYALRVAMSKLAMFAGIVALPIGGVLIASTKDNLVKTGKGIVGILLMSFIRIAVYSLFFDLIIYTVGVLLTPSMWILSIIAILLFLFMKVHKAIDLTLERSLGNIERTIAPEARQFKASAMAWSRSKIQEKRRQLQDPENGKIVGYEEDGTPIRQSSRGGIFDTVLGVAENAMTTNFEQHKGLNKIRREAKKERDKAENDVNHKLEMVARKKVESANTDINLLLKGIDNKAESEYSKIYDKETQSYNLDQLNEEEKALYDQLHIQELELNTHTNAEEYIKLRKKNLNGEQLTEEEQLKLDEYNGKELRLEKERNNIRTQLDNQIKDRLHNEAYESSKDQLKEAVLKAQDADKQVMDMIEENSKSGTNSKLNMDDFKNKKLHEKQLEQLENNTLVSDKLDNNELYAVKKEYDEYLNTNQATFISKITKKKSSKVEDTETINSTTDTTQKQPQYTPDRPDLTSDGAQKRPEEYEDVTKAQEALNNQALKLNIRPKPSSQNSQEQVKQTQSTEQTTTQTKQSAVQTQSDTVKKPGKVEDNSLLNGKEVKTNSSAVEVEGMTYSDAVDLFKAIKNGDGVVEESKSETASTIEDFDASSFLDDEKESA